MKVNIAIKKISKGRSNDDTQQKILNSADITKLYRYQGRKIVNKYKQRKKEQVYSK